MNTIDPYRNLSLVLALFFLFALTLSVQGESGKNQLLLANQIIRIDTNPVSIQGLKDLDALQDGIYHEDAVLHEVDMNAGIVVEFDEPTALSGFVAAVDGTFGNPSGYVWTIAKADNWDDMRNGTGSFEVIVPATLMTDAGIANLPFGDIHTAKVFQISGDNTVGNGYVSYREVAPVLESELPVVYQSVQTSPEGLNTNEPHRLFDGRTDSFALINPVENTPLEMVLNYGACRATWTTLEAIAGGMPNPDENTWMLEKADTMADLTGQTGSYQLLFDNRQSAGDQWLAVDLGGEVDGHLFRLTVLRRDDGWEHVAEVQPTVKELICPHQVWLPVVLDF